MDKPDHALEPETDPGVDDDTGEAADNLVDEEGEPTDLLALSEILPFAQYRLTLSEFDRQPSDRVQFALDQALIAAAERVRANPPERPAFVKSKIQNHGGRVVR